MDGEDVSAVLPNLEVSRLKLFVVAVFSYRNSERAEDTAVVVRVNASARGEVLYNDRPPVPEHVGQ